MNIVELDKALRQVCPILGISVGKKGDQRTWRIDFAQGATENQKSAALAILVSQSAIDEQRAISNSQLVQALIRKGLLTAAEIDSVIP